MSIKCFIDKSFYPPAPCTRAILVAEGAGIEGGIKLLIDTGASVTTIMDGDAEFLGIDVQRLKRAPVGLMGIGGSVDTYVMKETKLIFAMEDGGEHTEHIDALVVKHDLRQLSEGLRKRILAMPSLLGRDILNKRFKFIYDYNMGLVKLYISVDESEW